MLVKGTNYNPPTEYLFLDEKRKLKIVARVKKQISKFELTKDELGFVKIDYELYLQTLVRTLLRRPQPIRDRKNRKFPLTFALIWIVIN